MVTPVAASTTKVDSIKRVTQVAASTQRDPPQESEKLMDLNKSWHIKFPKDRYQFNGDSTVSIRPTKDPRATVETSAANAGREQAYRERDQETISWKDNQYS